MAGGGGGGEGEPEFQIAPMIDVLLVLLIFFMSIASTSVQRYDPSIELPVAPDAEEKPDSQGELVFNLAWNDANRTAVMTFEERPVTRDALVAVLTARQKTNPGARVLIRGDDDTPVRHVAAVVEAAGQAGLADVTFATLVR